MRANPARSEVPLIAMAQWLAELAHRLLARCEPTPIRSDGARIATDPRKRSHPRRGVSASLEPMRCRDRLKHMTCSQALTALILTAAALSSCSTEQRGAGQAVDSVKATPVAAPTDSKPSAAPGKQWACSPDRVSGFITDPVVFPADLSMTEVASELDGKTFTIDSNNGRQASVTFRNEQGLVVDASSLKEASRSAGTLSEAVLAKTRLCLTIGSASRSPSGDRWSPRERGHLRLKLP